MIDDDVLARLVSLHDHIQAPVTPPGSDASRGRRMLRRRHTLVATAAVIAVVAAVETAAAIGTGQRVPEPAPAVPTIATTGPATNGWVALDGYRSGGDIYLVRPGEAARRLKDTGSDGASAACPAWSPDGERLLFGRANGSSDPGPSNAELVIVAVGSDGATGAPRVIGLDGFDVLDGFDPHPCGIWSPDGRWVAFAGTGAVWVVDTQTGAIRRLPNLRPSDLEWRPGTTQLAIAGDMGLNRAPATLSTPVRIYSVVTAELDQLGSVEAAHITWSPDGTTLAYTGGETDARGLWLVDADGANERLLVTDMGEANHGIGPVWSPRGDRIAYQRLIAGRGEAHEVVLVNSADGTESVIKPPETAGPGKSRWYPDAVWWAPDGTTLLYSAWSEEGPGKAGPVGGGVIAVPADKPSDARLLIAGLGAVPENYSHRWAPIQMWGRQPG